jgi:hypothetical protein
MNMIARVPLSIIARTTTVDTGQRHLFDLFFFTALNYIYR